MLVNLAETTVLKAENVFAVTARDGALPLADAHPLGVFMDDCRHLRGHELTVAGEPPLLLVSTTDGRGRSLHELTNAEVRLPTGATLPLQSLQIRLARELLPEGGMTERIAIRSHVREPLELEIELALDADFAPMLAIRTIIEHVAEPERHATPDGVYAAARGRDGVVRTTTVHAVPPPSAPPEDGRLRWTLAIEPGALSELRVDYEFAAQGPAPAPGRPDPEPAFARVSTDDELVNRVLERSLVDVSMLRSSMQGEHYYAAGVPWYATLFGRDSLITALQMLPYAPEIAEGTLRLLAARLGAADDPLREEEPGKVIHEVRVGEAAAPGVTPLARYYGTVDATPLFLCVLAEHADWTGDLSLLRSLRSEVDAMLAWIDGPGDHDGDGWLDYAARAPGGLRNQGWKDSDDGVCDEYGVSLEPPIALVEAQAYAIRAKDRLARLCALDGDEQRAGLLREQSARARERLDAFWLDELGYYSMGIGGDGRPSRALASNQGHVLWALRAPLEHAAAVREALMGERMFSGWGIRTLAEGEVAYNPVGYHLGTVWPHDTALAAAGLREHGFDGDFARVFEALIEAAWASDSYRLPELFAGVPRAEFGIPVPYPAACRPQAWAAGAIPFLLVAGLGLVPDGIERRLRIRRPWLPRWVRRLEMRDLRVAGSIVDLEFERAGTGGPVMLADAHVRGDLELVLETRGEP